MPRYIAILFALPLLLSCNESTEAKPLAQKKTEAEFEDKLKSEYEKKFGMQITEAELSTTHIYYEYDGFNIVPQISVTRTATGAIAKYREEVLELELDLDGWLDLVNATYKYGIRKLNGLDKKNDMGRKYGGNSIGLTARIDMLNDNMGKNDWPEFVNVMEAMKAKIIEDGGAKLEARLKIEYEKKFGIPISDFELSITDVHYQYFNRLSQNLNVEFSATRTTSGASIKYKDEKLELDIGDWLDFVNILYKYNIDKLEKRYYSYTSDADNFERWHISIYSFDKKEISSIGINAYPNRWDEFIKAMNDFEAKIKSKAETK